jgi:hypothetical protein
MEESTWLTQRSEQVKKPKPCSWCWFSEVSSENLSERGF